MTDTALGAASEPDGAPRLLNLDVLRGIAILGILFMNINDMGASLNASFGDFRHLGWSAPDQVAWWARQVFANGTARCLLEMLFGAGMVILTGRMVDDADRWKAMKSYYWRNVVLFAFGVVHIVVLLWPGDILHTYAIAALLIFPFRALRPRKLLMIGLSLATLQLVGGTIGYVVAAHGHAAYDSAQAKQAAGKQLTKAETIAAKARADRAVRKAAEAKEVAAEDAARGDNVATWIAYQWHEAASLQAQGIEPVVVLEAFTTMLIGAALFKLGWLQGGRSARWYAHAMLIAYAVALVLRVQEARDLTSLVVGAPRVSWATIEYGRLAMTLGHLFLVNWMLASAIGQRLLAPFRAAGQTALTLYICQTLATLWVLFPPWGFALYGRFGWAALMGIALVINVGLLIAANIWVRYFRIAPVEWAWRSLVAGRRLPFRREPRAVAA